MVRGDVYCVGMSAGGILEEVRLVLCLGVLCGGSFMVTCRSN